MAGLECGQKKYVGSHGICSKLGKYLVAAPGGRNWTATAAEYPKCFAAASASVMESSADLRRYIKPGRFFDV